MTVRGTFNEHLDGLETELEDGDPVALNVAKARNSISILAPSGQTV